MAKLRTSKSEFEKQLIQTACDITNKAFRRVLAFVKPGVMEYEIEAEIMHYIFE
jgi:Xaa-Pro aminopeptidase